ncbi:DUF2939 domain-containing protein [Phenylobacterium sp.]|uniref:DUF2939 domain-containing protein n=1 Tax=Phenylobacterium sp. TaxID=1871053 RepID=UPI0027314E51|nr:DUF2939 domain-containing protein [Phenylobacterium sp.]MDP1617821.1 DUF2939 domain-containing protein [Phenylobacterium sp.]MDP1987491.1 DUF2939 domain-containing protein [Phenylobacterium sp.]
MFKSLRLLAPLALALTLSACAGGAQRLDAAGDVHALLTAIRDGDQAAFDRHVDRQALRRQIEARIAAEVSRSGGGGDLGALGALLGPAIAQAASEQLVQPQVFRGVAEYYGYDAAQPLPGRVAIAGSLKALDDGRVCATREKDGPCLLIFTQTEGVWRLSGFEGDIDMLRR